MRGVDRLGAQDLITLWPDEPAGARTSVSWHAFQSRAVALTLPRAQTSVSGGRSWWPRPRLI